MILVSCQNVYLLRKKYLEEANNMTSKPPKSDVRRIGSIVKESKRTLEAVNKVKQTGIGFKRKDGKIMTDTVAMIFYVRFKPKINALRRLNIEPLPKEIEGIPTDVVEIPTGFDKRIVRLGLRIATPDDSRHRPVPGGVAMVNANGLPSTGTLGLIFQKRNTNEFFACTNNHVGANEDIEGLSPTAQIGDPWIQPGAHGSGHHPQDTIAILDRWGRMKLLEKNHYDFAIGKINDGVDVKPNHIEGVGDVSGIADIELGDIVLKRGRTTRARRGMVTDVLIDDVTVPYQQGQPCRFEDQVSIVGIPETDPFSLSGDSGSFVVSEESPHTVKAQLFAGGEDSDGIDVTIASPIRKIAEDFDLDL
jgi:hypothetical protein